MTSNSEGTQPVVHERDTLVLYRSSGRWRFKGFYKGRLWEGRIKASDRSEAQAELNKFKREIEKAAAAERTKAETVVPNVGFVLHDQEVAAPMAQYQPGEGFRPRGLSRSQAANYVGIGVTFFDTCVVNGIMPKPKVLGKRVLWDIRELDEAFEALPHQGEEDAPSQKHKSDIHKFLGL